MKKISLFVIGLAMISLAMSQTASPELVSSAGENFNNSTYQLDWSIGECATTTHSAGSYTLTQGFHQSTLVATEVEDLATDINISVYPNPTTNLLMIDFLTSEGLGNVITVTDINGKTLQQAEVTTDREQLNFSDYANGVYFISVSQLRLANGENQIIKSFKIIKK